MRLGRLASLTLVVLAVGSGCDNNFVPEWKVEGLRTLGIQAQPADLRPGQTAAIDSLVVDPSRAGQPNIVIWAACDPDAAQPERSPCSNTDALQALALSTGSGSGSSLPPGVRRLGVSGLNPIAYSAPAGLFDALAVDDPLRTNGVVVQLLSYAIAEDPAVLATEEGATALGVRIQSHSVATELSLFRIRVSEDNQTNSNPVATAITADGAALEPDRFWRLLPGASARLELAFPPEAFERYRQLEPDGETEKTEQLVVAYYVTEGALSNAKAFIGSGTEQRFTAPPLDSGQAREAREAHLWAVTRDTRGGQSWLERKLFLCDPTIANPVVSGLEGVDSGGERRLRVHGTGLGATLELEVGGQLATGLSIRDDLVEGVAPPLAPGSYPVVLHTRGCRDVQASDPYLAP